MHSLLHTRDAAGCAQVIQAFEECHARGFIHRSLGRCNALKQAVTACLHAQREERSAQNRREARARAARVAKKWAEWDNMK